MRQACGTQANLAPLLLGFPCPNIGREPWTGARTHNVEGRNDEAFTRRIRRELSYSTQVHGQYLAQTRAAQMRNRKLSLLMMLMLFLLLFPPTPERSLTVTPSHILVH